MGWKHFYFFFFAAVVVFAVVPAAQRGGIGDTDSPNDVNFFMFLFQGTDAMVGDGFTSLGESHGKGTNNRWQRTNIATTRPIRWERKNISNISSRFRLLLKLWSTLKYICSFLHEMFLGKCPNLLPFFSFFIKYQYQNILLWYFKWLVC